MILDRFPRGAIFVIVTVPVMLALFAYASYHDGVLCELDCGEVGIAFKFLDDFRAVGFKYYLLENFGTIESPSFYTHNVNIGSLLFVGFDLLNVHSNVVRQAVVLGIFSLGLYYAFSLMALIAKRSVPAVLLLLLMCTNYWGVLAFAMNPLRAWHYVGLFGVMYHIETWYLAKDKKTRSLSMLGLLLTASVAFGCGYDFWLISAMCSFMFVLFRPMDFEKGLSKKASLGFLVLAFLLPFAVRQLQIVLALGFDYWFHDIVYSVGIKIPGAGAFFGLPTLDVVDSFYRMNHVFRPPAFPSNSLKQILFTLYAMLWNITFPRWGFITIGLWAVASIYSIATLVFGAAWKYSPPSYIGSLLVRILLPLNLGVFIGLAIFAPFSLHVYFKHEFPLLAAPLLIAKAIIVYWGSAAIVSKWGRTSTSAMWTLVVVSIVAGDAYVVHRNGSLYGNYLNLGWANFVRNNPDHKYAISAYFLTGFPAMLGLSDENGKVLTLESINNVRLSFGTADGRNLVSELIALADRYDYWVYQPTSRYHNFDHNMPECIWKDPILEQLRPISFGAKFHNARMVPEEAAPGSFVSLGGRVFGVQEGDRFEFSYLGTQTQGGATSSRLNGAAKGQAHFNCLYGSVSATGRLSPDFEGIGKFELSVIHRDGTSTLLHFHEVKVDKLMPSIGPSNFEFRPHSPRVSEIVSYIPQTAAIASSNEGIGYLIVDLKELRALESGGGQIRARQGD